MLNRPPDWLSPVADASSSIARAAKGNRVGGSYLFVGFTSVRGDWNRSTSRNSSTEFFDDLLGVAQSLIGDLVQYLEGLCCV